MILKRKDNRELDVYELERLLSLPLTANQKFLIERELKILRSGVKGEKDSAYFLDFSFKTANNHVVIHDLRLEHQGLTAQIDHLLIDRLLDFYILESKNFSYGIKITDIGEFMVWTGKRYQGIASPIEQNKRHIELLKKIIKANEIMPKRLGVTLSPLFKNYVLISPASRIDRPSNSKFDTSSVIKADIFSSEYEKEIPTAKALISVAKIVSTESIIEIGKKIIKLHKPGKINYAAKFGIKENSEEKPMRAKTAEIVDDKICAGCGAKVSEKVFKYCRENKNFFGGKVLCYKCQDALKKSTSLV
jgi:Nuclease-related domain